MRPHLIATTLGVAILLGCVSGPRIRHEHTLVPGKAHHPGIERALVIPINALIERPTGLDVADDRLGSIIVRQLEAHGLQVEQTSRTAFRRAEAAAAKRVHARLLSGEPGSTSREVELADVIPELLGELGSSAQIVVFPNIVVRGADYSGGQTVRWDGVRRRERGTRGGGMTGTTSAASLFTSIHSADGLEVFSGYGGLDLIYQLNMSERKYELRPDLFEDEKNLAEGVCISFHPYFGDDVDC